jgi:hypothetical protein
MKSHYHEKAKWPPIVYAIQNAKSAKELAELIDEAHSLNLTPVLVGCAVFDYSEKRKNNVD